MPKTNKEPRTVCLAYSTTKHQRRPGVTVTLRVDAGAPPTCLMQEAEDTARSGDLRGLGLGVGWGGARAEIEFMTSLLDPWWRAVLAIAARMS